MLSKKLVSVTCAALLAGCVYGLSAVAASAATPTLNGAGSTLVAPIEAEWAAVWDTANSTLVNYSPVGSGTGEIGHRRGLVDFGASDAPLSVYPTAPANLVQIPWALTATGVSYPPQRPEAEGRHPEADRVRARPDLSGPDHQLEQQGDQEAEQGREDPQQEDHGVLAQRRIRATRIAFTRYLSDVSGTFNSKVGSSTTVTFPIGFGAKRQRGHGAAVKATNGGIAYIAVSYLIANKLPAVAIKNGAGNYVVPNLSAIAAAASGIGIPRQSPAHDRRPGKTKKKAYPISTFTYAFVPTNAPQGSLIQSFIGYAITQGQELRALARLLAAAAGGGQRGRGGTQLDQLTS